MRGELYAGDGDFLTFFTLTPALSLRERGQTVHIPAFLPLPQGEGEPCTYPPFSLSLRERVGVRVY